MKRLAPLVLLVLLPAALPAQCPDFLVGAWEWEYSQGGIAGDTRTPATEGHTRQLEFLGSGIVREYQDEVLVDTRTWSLECSSPTSGLLTYAGTMFDPYDATLTELPDGRRLDLYPHGWMDAYNDRYIERDAVVGAEARTWGTIKALYLAD